MQPERFALYAKPPRQAVERTNREGLNVDCRRCPLRVISKDEEADTEELARVVGPEASQEDGATVLVVGGNPGSHENADGRPFMGMVGARVRASIRKTWKGRIVLDSATRCWAGRGKSKRLVMEPHVRACRPYLAETLAEARPERIVALGPEAILALTGRLVSPIQARRGYTWLWNGGKPVPVFFVLHPAVGAKNRFLARFYEEDLAWALKVKLPPPRHFDPDFFAAVVTTPADAAQAVDDCREGDGFAFDVETGGFLYDEDHRIIALACAPLTRETVWVWDVEALRDEALFGPLRELLEDEDTPKGGANVKYDVASLWCAKRVSVRGITFDVRLQRKLFDPEAGADLDLMAELVGMGGHKHEMEAALKAVMAELQATIESDRARATSNQVELDFGSSVDAMRRLGADIGNLEKYEGSLRAIAYAFVEKDILHRYVARDARSTARLATLFDVKMSRSPNHRHVWERVVLPASLAVQKVEAWGVPIDLPATRLFQQLMQQNMEAARARIAQYDPNLNPGSPAQLQEILFGRLGLKPIFETDSGQPSTNEATLQALRHAHPLPGHILEYRHYEKLIGYSKDWLRQAREDGRIHGSILLDGARSGRTSMSDPNLQNVPRPSDDDGRMARNCFVAPDGFVFVELDYSQLEFRIAALLARDAAMASLFSQGVDFHLGTAKLISKMAWGIPPEKVRDVHRTGAKEFNFGLLYGKTDRTLAAQLGVPVEEAAKIRQAIFGAFVELGKWTREALAYAVEHGGCWTYWEDHPARWRPLWRIADTSDEGSGAQVTARNGAVNSPVQGTASDFCVASITKLVNLIGRKQLDAEVILPIHDSIMLLVPERTWRDAALTARDAMTDYPWATKVVQLAVDAKVGKRWGELEKVQLVA